jgi:hypothetical protein
MQIYFLTIKECLQYKTISCVFKSSFGISDSEADVISDKLSEFLKDFRENISLIVETEYIDKVYRDSYYCYYSTKFKLPGRECIRLSLFDIENMQPQHLYDVKDLTKIAGQYLGFIVVRPTLNNPVGRNVISPNALINNNIKVCSTTVCSSIFGLELFVTGFPHSSQDTETMTCAETTVWSLMEYFGNKYPEYKPILPSKILQTLENRSHIRQVPSHGLIYEDISYILKKQGFGTIVYLKEEADFRKTFTCYIESGIPVVAAISNGKNIHHVLLCIGRADWNSAHYETLVSTQFDKKFLYEWNNNIEEFVFIDDNMAPYQKAKFSQPTTHYNLADWDSCEITHFIVPLYHKIYLEAKDAMDIANGIALKILNIDEKSIIKTFLVSNRSYKNYILTNPDMDIQFKDLILHENLPKFIWIMEISTVENLKKNKIIGGILLDATGKAHEYLASFILAYYKQDVYTYLRGEDKLKKMSSNTSFCFNAFDKNLISYN